MRKRHTYYFPKVVWNNKDKLNLYSEGVMFELGVLRNLSDRLHIIYPGFYFQDTEDAGWAVLERNILKGVLS